MPKLPDALIDAMENAAQDATPCDHGIQLMLDYPEPCMRCRIEAAAAALLDGCYVRSTRVGDIRRLVITTPPYAPAEPVEEGTGDG